MYTYSQTNKQTKQTDIITQAGVWLLCAEYTTARWVCLLALTVSSSESDCIFMVRECDLARFFKRDNDVY